MRHDEMKEHLLGVIRRGRDKGRTRRDLIKYSRQFASWPEATREFVLAGLAGDGLIRLESSTGFSGSGRRRIAWVATKSGTSHE